MLHFCIGYFLDFDFCGLDFHSHFFLWFDVLLGILALDLKDVVEVGFLEKEIAFENLRLPIAPRIIHLRRILLILFLTRACVTYFERTLLRPGG